MNHHHIDAHIDSTLAVPRFVLPASVRVHLAVTGLGDRLRRTWDERADETGVDEAVTKMIWLAVGIGVAIAATTFFVGVFNTAKSQVPDPVSK
jgi:hypothetical protein